jgi:hypothetical protein
LPVDEGAPHTPAAGHGRRRLPDSRRRPLEAKEDTLNNTTPILLHGLREIVRVADPESTTVRFIARAIEAIEAQAAEIVRLQATVAIQARRAPLSAEERRALVVALRVGAKDGVVDLPPLKVGKLAIKLEGGRRL